MWASAEMIEYFVMQSAPPAPGPDDVRRNRAM
jgi:hypothetical protein